jgi:hypothetical protein
MLAARVWLARSGFVLASVVASSSVAFAAQAPTADGAAAGSEAGQGDGGVTSANADPEKDDAPRVPFRGSTLFWDNAASVDTLGVGQDYQSGNPVYEMAFGFRPRYYFRDVEAESLSVRGDIALLREFTDSDSTTERGEWTFTDAEVWLAYVRRVNDSPGATTDLILRAPQLILPTSKVSASNGKILGLGLGGGVEQQVPLRGEDSSFLSKAALRVNARYVYQFVSSTVPTSDDIDRVRLGPDGRSLPSDQLSGSAFTQHQGAISVQADLGLVRDLTLSTEFGMRYAYRRALDERVEVCNVVATGCAEVETREDATRYGVSTLFNVELGYDLTKQLSLALGYSNLTQQLGADGQRRQPFYSHDARGYFTVTLALDELYLAARGDRTTADAGTVTHQY